MSQTARHKRWKNLLIALFIVVASSIGTLLFIEVMVRAFFPAYDPSGQVEFVRGANDLVLGPPNHRLRQTKNTGDYDVSVEFNGYGFRDSKDIQTAQFGDIVVVGDSFAFGWGVEESQRFSNVVQSRLRRTVFNIAIGGTNFELQQKLLEYAESLGAKIDTVLVAVCMENDLYPYGASGKTGRGDQNDGIVASIVQEVPSLTNAKIWLTHNSAVYRMLTTAVQQSPRLKSLAVRANLLVPNLDGIPTNAYSREVIERSATRLAEIARRYKHATILIIPSRGLWVGNHRAVEDRVHREFVAALTARHLTVVDMRDVFESRGDPLSNHFRNDGHWNTKGHRLAAEELVKAFAQRAPSGA